LKLKLMKKYLFLIFLFCLSAAAKPQAVAVTAMKNNVFYIGVDNPFTIVVQNLPADDILVKADKGEVFGSSMYKTYRGIEPGNISIILYDQQTSREIGRSSFRLKLIPDPIAKIGKYNGGSIARSILAGQLFINAELIDFD